MIERLQRWLFWHRIDAGLPQRPDGSGRLHLHELLTRQAPLARSPEPADLTRRTLEALPQRTLPGHATVAPDFPWRAAAALTAAVVVLIILATPRTPHVQRGPVVASQLPSHSTLDAPSRRPQAVAVTSRFPLVAEAVAMIHDAQRTAEAFRTAIPRRPRLGDPDRPLTPTEG